MTRCSTRPFFPHDTEVRERVAREPQFPLLGQDNDGPWAQSHAREVALLYAFWALAEAVLERDLIEPAQFFGRSAAALTVLQALGHDRAAAELEEIIRPLADTYAR